MKRRPKKPLGKYRIHLHEENVGDLEIEVNVLIDKGYTVVGEIFYDPKEEKFVQVMTKDIPFGNTAEKCVEDYYYEMEVEEYEQSNHEESKELMERIQRVFERLKKRLESIRGRITYKFEEKSDEEKLNDLLVAFYSPDSQE